jgi:signal recognition particle subunit SRP72
LVREDGGADPTLLASLVLAAADFDTTTAETWAGRLEDIQSLLPISPYGALDVDMLETKLPCAGTALAKKEALKKSPQSSDGTESGQKKRRKRKKILPKSYDPNVPPNPGN